MGVLSLANVFTGMAVDFGRLKRVVGSRESKHPLTKLPFIDVGSVTPSVIGSRSVAIVAETKLREVDDDRWCQVEGGSPSRLRSCSACTFLCAEHESKCAACGTLTPLESSADRFHCSTPKNSSSPEATVITTVVPDEVPHEAPEQAPEHTSLSSEASVVKSPEPTEDAKHEDGDNESEGEEINGTLDVPPTPGTQVRVLFDDDRWHLAQVLVTRNARARVRFENGEQAMLDFEVDAVRLASYASDDEEDDHEENGEDDDVEEEEEDEEEGHEALEGERSVAGEANDSTPNAGYPEEKSVADCQAEPAQVNEEDSDSDDEEQIEGTLDDAPPVGTLVKVLYDDDKWYQARVTETKGTKAVVVFQDDEEEELDLQEHAVRLFDYVDQNEEFGTIRPEDHSRENEPSPRIAEEHQIGANSTLESTSRTDEAMEVLESPKCEVVEEICSGKSERVAPASIIGRVSDA